jgi:hypothetical protein
LSVQSLTRALLDEADLLDELLDAAVEQRELLKSGNKDGNPSRLQDLMKRVQDISFRVQAQEAQRVRLTEAAAQELQCEPRFSALAEAVSEGEGERALFKGAGERLKHSVFALKSEMAILSGLIDQNERFSAMLLSEWRRLDAGFMRSGGLDFRG